MVNKQFYFYQTVVGKQTVVYLIPLFKNFFNPFFVSCKHKQTFRILTKFIMSIKLNNKIIITTILILLQLGCKKDKEVIEEMDNWKPFNQINYDTYPISLLLTKHPLSFLNTFRFPNI